MIHKMVKKLWKIEKSVSWTKKRTLRPWNILQPLQTSIKMKFVVMLCKYPKCLKGFSPCFSPYVYRQKREILNSFAKGNKKASANWNISIAAK